MSSVEPSSSGEVEQTIKDGIKSDDKLSAAALQNLTLRSETILDCSTEKVAVKGSSAMRFLTFLKNFS